MGAYIKKNKMIWEAGTHFAPLSLVFTMLLISLFHMGARFTPRFQVTVFSVLQLIPSNERRPLQLAACIWCLCTVSPWNWPWTTLKGYVAPQESNQELWKELVLNVLVYWRTINRSHINTSILYLYRLSPMTIPTAGDFFYYSPVQKKKFELAESGIRTPYHLDYRHSGRTDI